jgi:hypothetical protein
MELHKQGFPQMVAMEALVVEVREVGQAAQATRQLLHHRKETMVVDRESHQITARVVVAVRQQLAEQEQIQLQEMVAQVAPQQLAVLQ